MFSIIYEWQANADSFSNYDGGFETLDTVPTLREALKVLRDKAGSSSDFVEWADGDGTAYQAWYIIEGDDAAAEDAGVDDALFGFTCQFDDASAPIVQSYVWGAE